MNKLIARFKSADQSVSNVFRDATGALVSWMENGMFLSVDRNVAGSFVTLTLSAGSAKYSEFISFDSSGCYIGGDSELIPSVFSSELRNSGVSGNIQPLIKAAAKQIVPWKSLASISDVGQSYFVHDIGAELVEVKNNGFGWRPVRAFGIQPLFSEYTHADTSVGVGVPWAITLPAGLLHFGCIEITPVVTFPSSASSKKIELKVNGTAMFSKTRTTSTHEAPIIIISARDSGVINYPYYTNSVPISGGTGFTNLNNISVDNRTTDIELRFETSFSAVGSGTESIVTRYLRAEFKPF